MNLKIDYSEEGNYIIRKFQGKLNPKDLLSSWELLIKEKLRKEELNGVISIYSDVELDMELDDFDSLLDLFKKNAEFLENLKIAIVMETHINRVFPLLTLRYSQFNIRSFSRLDTAKEWMLES